MEVVDNKSKAYEDSMAGKKKTVEKDKRAAKEKRAAEATVSSPESTRSGSGSPEPNCAICLGKLQNKSFTDSCFHMFCFTCLLEWSKVKAVCPLCKQAFKSIIHNVRSNQEYDQYFLRPEESGSPDGGRFRYRSTLTTERWMFRQQMEQQRQLRMLQRPTSHTARSQWRRMRQAATSAFRQHIYTENMWVRDLSHPPNRPPRYRNISVAFFKRNPAASHRLVPWLNRELNVILHNREDHVQFVLELIMDLIKRFEIQSEEFLEHIRSFMGERSEHFVHEFYSFARSPYDMVAYDSHAIYDEPEPQVHSIESDSSSDNDDVILVSPNGRSNQDSDDVSFSNPEPPNVNSRNTDLSPLLTRVRDFLAFIDTSQMGGWDSPLPGPSSLRWSPVTTSLSEIERSQPTSSQRDSHHSSRRLTVELSPSNDEDDIMIVGYEKAWDRRTPIQLSSGDESSSPEKQSSSCSQRKHRKNHESKSHSHEKKKTKSSRRRHSRSHSSEGHSSHRRSRSRERHQSSRDKRRLRDHSPEESRASTSRSKPKHHRFSSDSPSRKRSRRSMSSEYSYKSSGKLRSRSKEHHHHTKSSSPHSRRRDISPSPRLQSSSPEYCGSYRHDRGRYYHERVSERHRSYYSYKNHRQNHGSRSRETSIESRAESNKRHRHHSSSSIETIYEKSRSDSKHHKSRKQKKQKKHKKHKSKGRERKPDNDDDSSTGVEIVEISEDEARGKSEEHQESQDSHRWKKHPTGHKKSSKSKSEGNSSDTTSSSTHTGQESTEPSSSYSEPSSFHPAYSEMTPLLNCVRNFLADAAETDSREASAVKSSSSSYDLSKWKPVGGGNKKSCGNEPSESQLDALRCNETLPGINDQKDKETKEKWTGSNTETSSCTPDSQPSSSESPPCSTTDNNSSQISPSTDPECTDERSVEPDSSCGGEYTSHLKSKILENIETHQDSLHEIEKTLRANILNRLSNSKSLHTDTPSSAS